MVDFFYNGILAAIIVLWILGSRWHGGKEFIAGLKRYRNVIVASLWIVFIAFAATFIICFDYFEEIHDIDDAVDAAVNEFPDGTDVYEEDVIPRFKERYVSEPVWALGPYNYLPLDLYVYTCVHLALGVLGAPVWFVTANTLFASAAMYLLREMTGIRWLSFAPLAGIVVLFYSFDNGSLTLLLMVSSLFLRERLKTYPESLSLIVMGLATLTKIYAALPLAVMLLFDIQNQTSRRDWRKLMATIVSTALLAAIAIASMLPFGVADVLDSAVFFHASESSRNETSAGGTLLSEVALDSPYFAEVGMAFVVAALLIGVRVQRLSDRVLFVMIVFLLVAVKSSLAPLTVPGIFLVLRLRDSAREKMRS